MSPFPFVRALLRPIVAFAADRAGATAMPFALTVLGLGALYATTADYGRAQLARSVLSEALDSATLAAARDLADAPRTQAEVETRVADHLAGNVALNQPNLTVTGVGVTIDTVNGRLVTSATGEIASVFPFFSGSPSLAVGAHASSTYESKTIELAMVLDVTGSMSGQKITDLKTAATEMVNTLLPADGRNDTRVRIAVVPFAAAVNAGGYADTVRVSRRSGYSNTCVTEANADAFSDPDPTAPKTLRGDASSCPSATVLPLTNNRTALLDKIAGLSAGGNTAGHLGVRWGWFTLSPNWTPVWPTASDPVAYGTPKTLKIVVFMTDGDFNQQYVSSNGTSNQQALAVCEAAKASAVSIYTVAFSTPTAPLSGTASALMSSCATSTRQYYAAGNGNELIAAFRTIAANIQMIYLTS